MGSLGAPQPSSPEKKFATSLTDYSTTHSSKTGPYAENLDIDALIVGAGFAGIFMLKTLRDRGLRTTIYEAGNDTGGTWRWNCYPGAAVDSEVPEYEFSWPEVYETWNWKSNYPTYQELREYFDHVDKVIGVKKDCAFNTVVVGAEFDVKAGKWSVRTADGRVAKARFLVLGTGFAAKRWIPPWPGLSKYRGVIHHSSFWPDAEIPVRSKRCAVIGTGASGVQITQAWGPLASHLKVFQRTPNLALPMQRRPLSIEDQVLRKRFYPELFRYRETSFAGFLYDWAEKNTFDDSAAEREQVYEKAWAEGGFHFWVSIYKDNLFDAEANKESYKFWAKKVRSRIGDPELREKLAPKLEEMPHYFGVKRPCLETDYYEQFNRESVELVDIKSNPISHFTERGIVLADGTEHEVDVVAVATGFDVVTGVMTQLGLKSIDGTSLEEEWAPGAQTYLGTTVSGYPNMFHIYGAHGPTLLSNGPTTVAVQGRWIADTIAKIEANGVKYINPKKEASEEWKRHVIELNDRTLFPTTQSTYMGGSIPGKAYEPVCYAGGLPTYVKQIREALDHWEEGFEVVREAARL
ncbi:flavin-containing monooxygenase [Aspergillus mulundensis]|uniref:FAD/NAD(P)-binding domain-containing protein n=1 Tax=Aspergillus mulundensis TaxID=1810919 RepID=A0A3D8QVF4_9EURO|nr:hypothetical protein DSM5745_09496 [Aspergillus mulundensis]RDW65757.1 hypothetical protein DSM5745_09496 [Aspergillus mulundensis]